MPSTSVAICNVYVSADNDTDSLEPIFALSLTTCALTAWHCIVGIVRESAEVQLVYEDKRASATPFLQTDRTRVPIIAVIIPTKNEEQAVGLVLDAIPVLYRQRVTVVDNGSDDRTIAVAQRRKAIVLREERSGYGNVMLRGLTHLAHDPPDIVVFLDGDFSDYPEEMDRLVTPIARGHHDMALSTRLNPLYDKGSLPLHVIYGNKFCVFLINRLFGTRYTDLGPFRAIRYTALVRLNMEDKNYGWTAEMQIKAKLHGLRVVEVPLRYRRRVGRSKVSGTIMGSIFAGSKILYTIFRLRLMAHNATLRGRA
jgi:glycosyltransferase involved in cell wall biosynthesis